MLEKIDLERVDVEGSRTILGEILDLLKGEKAGVFKIDEKTGAVVTSPVLKFGGQIERLLGVTGTEVERTCSREFVNLFGDVIDACFRELCRDIGGAGV